MLEVPYTPEDAVIVMRAIERGNTGVLYAMIMGDEADALRMLSRAEARYLDETYAAYLDEQMEEWWREQDEAMSWTEDDELELELELQRLAAHEADQGNF